MTYAFKIIIGSSPDWDFAAIVFDCHSQEEALEKYQYSAWGRRMVRMFGARVVLANDWPSKMPDYLPGEKKKH